MWQKYLGTLDSILERTAGAQPAKPKETVIFEAGAVAALLGIAQRLELTQLIDQHAPKRGQGPSVGHYMLLAALNRAVCPCSKLAIGEWYEQTVLRRLWGFDPGAFSSQRFWDHMDRLSQQAIELIEQQLVERVQKHFALDARILLYDTTNFFTFIATGNQRSHLAQRGHNKQKRHDLRQVGLALLVARDFQIPLLHHTYTGSTNDARLFGEHSRQLVKRYQQITGGAPEATLVFDRGNLCEDGMEHLVVGHLHFVAGLPAHYFPDLVATPLEQFSALANLPASRAFCAARTLWAKPCQVVVVYSESLFTQQLSGVTHALAKCQEQLSALSKTLERWQQGKSKGVAPSRASVEKKVREIVSVQFMKDLFKVEIVEQRPCPGIVWQIDRQGLHRLSEQRLGRTLLVTDRLEWSSGEVVAVYRTLAGVEQAFKNMKNVDFLRWQPAYHWTDQKLRVHGFYCVLALLLASLCRKHAVPAGEELSIVELLEELSAIREVAVIYPPSASGSVKNHIALSRMSPRQRRLAEQLQIGEVLSHTGQG